MKIKGIVIMTIPIGDFVNKNNIFSIRTFITIKADNPEKINILPARRGLFLIKNSAIIEKSEIIKNNIPVINSFV